METGSGAGAAATGLLDATLFQDLGKPAALTDLLDALEPTAIVLGDNGLFNSSCMGTLSAVDAANSFDLEGVELAKVHGNTTSVQGDTGGTAFSLLHYSLIRDCPSNSFHPIHACALSRLDRFGVGVGVSGVGVACPPLSSLLFVSRVGDDVNDACMDGSNSLIQGSGCHATACACSDALQNSRQVRGHCLRGGTKCSSMGSGTKVWLSDEIMGSLSHEMPESLHVETWAGAQECPPPHEFFQVWDFPAGCASVSFPACCSDLTSVLPGPGSEIRKQLGWIQMEETDRSGVWFFRSAFQGKDFFSSLAVSGDGLKGVVPHSVVGPLGFLVLVFICVWAWHSYRATHGKAVLGAALVVVEDYRSPDEALVC